MEIYFKLLVLAINGELFTLNKFITNHPDGYTAEMRAQKSISEFVLLPVSALSTIMFYHYETLTQ